MSENIEIAAVIPASAERVFRAWLSAEEHGKMTATTCSASSDGSFTAGDGYITGRTLEQAAPSRIVQAWRTTEFPAGAPDSRLTVHLEAAGTATRVRLVHENLPDGQGERYRSGWNEFYFQPMVRYFGSPASRLRGVGQALEAAATKAMGEVASAAEQARTDATAAVKKAVSSVKKARKKAATRAAKARTQAVARAKSIKKAVKKALAKRGPKKKAGGGAKRRGGKR